MSLNIAKSFAGFAKGLKSWLNNKERWNHVYNNSLKALACWLEDLQQANKFNNALIKLISEKPQLGAALREDYNKIVELAQKIDNQVETSEDLQQFPSVCKALYQNQVPEWFESDVKDFECKLAEFLATIQGTKDGMIPLKLPTRRVPLAKAAEWFGCDYRTLKNDIKSGKIKARPISDRRWEFDLDQVTEFDPSVRADADPTEGHNTR